MVEARKRGGSSDTSLSTSKRARTRVEARDDEPNSTTTYERFQGAKFPLEIQTLTHILDQIDMLLMTHQEAVMEAARSGKAAWLRQLIQDDDDKCTEAPMALVVAAANGNMECVKTLLNAFFDSEEALQYWDRQQIIHEAVQAASGNGHHSILEFLLRDEFYYSSGQATLAVWAALDGAATNGRLDGVKFALQHLPARNYANEFIGQRSLARAITGGHSTVVEFLLGLNRPSWWDLVAAFAAAIDVGLPALADRILAIYANTRDSYTPLLVELAALGATNAVKSLFYGGAKQSKLVSDAFEKAAMNGYVDTTEFLLSTGLVSNAAFNRALEESVNRKNAEMLILLCGKKRASPRSVNRAFKSSIKLDMVQYLYENEDISSASVIALFKNAARCGKTSRLACYPEDEIAILRFLLKDECIPAKVIGKALVSAVSKNKMDLAAVLDDDARITAEMAQEALVAAPQAVLRDRMRKLCDTKRSH